MGLMYREDESDTRYERSGGILSWENEYVRT